LLDQAKMGDAVAWQRLEFLYTPLVRWWCRRHGVWQLQDAEDVTQEVFLAMAGKLAGFMKGPPGSFRSWLQTITRHKAQDFYRRRRVRPAATGGSAAQQRLEDLPEATSENSVAEHPVSERAILVRRALEMVRPEFQPRTWHAAWQMVVESQRPTEVAAALGMSAGALYTAKSRVSGPAARAAERRPGRRAGHRRRSKLRANANSVHQAIQLGSWESALARAPCRVARIEELAMGDDCPTADELIAFAVGRLPTEAREATATHIEECAACLATLHKLQDQDDTLLCELRKPVPAELFNEEDHLPRSSEVVQGSMGAARPPVLPGYQVLGELGRGGMGVVYRAVQTELKRAVAIKMILGGKYTGPIAQARFLVEAEVIAAVQHPHVVQVFEFGRHDDQPYFVLEFVGGGSLAARCKAAGRLEPRDAATLVAKLADGMAAAHQKGVIHRDLKPANVLLTDAGEPKITDFGLAKIEQSDMTASGAVIGTPSYMSPEQAAGKSREVGTPTDVYALGAVLYELTTGARPFSGDTPMETIQLVLTHEATRPRALDPRIPRDLETICLKCLAKDAKKRYGTAAELATELRAFLDGKPIAARPVGCLERSWKWAKRNPGWATGIAAALLLLVAATVAAVIIREQMIEQYQATYAAGLVWALLNADTPQAPAIIAEIAHYRRWADPILQGEHARADAASRERLHVSLALLPVDPGQVDYLYRRLLDAQPQEVSLIRDALAPHKEALLKKLWVVVESPEKGNESQRLRAAAALAQYEPRSQKWAQVQKAIGNDLVAAPQVHLTAWMEALRPVRAHLLPQLGTIYRHRERREVERALATDILADYARDDAQTLADLLMDADEQQFGTVYTRLNDHATAAIRILNAEVQKKPPVAAPNRLVFEQKGKIADSDAKVKVSNGPSLPAQRFEVKLEAGKQYQLTMDSTELDSLLVVQDPSGNELANDDNSGGNLNSLLLLTPRADGPYLVFAAAVEKTGAFHVKIAETFSVEDAKEKLGKRQANAAVALLRLGQPQ
jgi:RNA polymerase sigma factor (sigma-70 family)